MRTDEDRDAALKMIDTVVEDWFLADDILIEAIAYAISCGVSQDEVARRVTAYSQPTLLTVLALIRRRNHINQLLAAAGISVLTSDDTDEVWLYTNSKPRRGITLEHDEDNLADADQNALADTDPPGTPGRIAVAEQVAAAVVPCLYDAGFELAAGTTRLTRDEAERAFADPDASLWIEESSRT